MSDNSSDEEFATDWVPYGKRPEWEDVTPLEQDDGENPVVVIVYSEKFVDVYNYFRAIVATSEKSERALELTEDALVLNAANYTVWQYRREILKEIGADLTKELYYVGRVIEDNPKNYQVWHHRRVIVEWLQDSSSELKLTEHILNMDSKNYHAWQHRQWAIQTFDLFDEELVYVDRLISQDLRNNSAWNQRFFVLKHTGLTADVLEREINYVINRIELVKNNESPWNFLRGLLQQCDKCQLDQSPKVLTFCEDLYKSGNRSPYFLAFLIDMYEEMYLNEANVADEPVTYGLDTKISELCTMMSTKYDKIRSKYWDYVFANFDKKSKALRAM